MPRYMIVRSFDVGEADMPAVGTRSRSIVDHELTEITWEHSHVVVGDQGFVRSYCVYLAPSEEALRAHASKLGHHTIEGLHEIVGDMTPSDSPPT